MGTSAIGGMNIVLSANAASFSAGIAQAQAQLNRLSGAAKSAGGSVHGMVSPTQAASAAIRTLEGGMHGNIRAAERFLTTIPGVGKALLAAFPIAGAIAVAGIFVKIGTEAATFIETMRRMPQAVENGFRTLNQSAQTTNDTMAVTNDRLANEIAKLEGKPQNNLKVAIDEARVAADKLAEALDSDLSKVDSLLTKNHVGAFGLFAGQGSTSDVEGGIRSYEQKFADIGANRNIAVHSGDTGAVATADKALADAQASALNYVADQIKRRRAGEGLGNQGAAIADLQGFRTNILAAQDKQSSEATNIALQKQKNDLESAKALQEAQKKAAREALEAYKQAQAAIVAQWRKDLDEARANSDMTLAQEGQFWVRRIEAAKRGSISYIAAIDEANKLIARMRQGNMRDAAAFEKTASESYAPSSMDLSRSDQGAEHSTGRESMDFLRSLNDQIVLRQQNADALAEESIRMGELTGTMSRMDAAQATAALHTREYNDYLTGLHNALTAIANDPALTDLQKAQATADVNKSGIQAAGQRAIQVGRDRQDIASNQVGPAIQQTLGQMVQAWKDMTGQITQILSRTVDGLNENIVRAVTGQRTNFGAVFQQAGQGLLKTGLQRAEGALLGGLGLGKADGSSATSAIWVRMASGVTSAAGAAGGLLSRIPGVSWLQSIFGGARASGGDVLAGRGYLVGERGPEPFFPGTNGTILPNSSLGGGGNTTHYYAVDARGATDPAAIHAAVARALPHAVAASTQANHQMQRRTPRGR